MRLIFNAKSLKISGLLIIALVVSITLKAEIKLPLIFGDKMVLQQRTNASLWGKANPNSTVEVITSWDKNRYVTKSELDGSWKISVKTPDAGGPYNIVISDGKKVVLDDILIGEVWFCSGQSNMVMPMKGYYNQPVLGSNEAIAKSSNASIRLFTVQRSVNVAPIDDFSGGQWESCTPEKVANFSATAYFFAKMIQEALNVPVGVICSSWGGTKIEPWISEEGLKPFEFISIPDPKAEDELSYRRPTVLYNAMVNPLVGYAIKGVLWYQGEANRNEPANYSKLLPGLISSWRNAWGIGDFPFYYVQIAPFDNGLNRTNSAFFREVQLKVSASTSNVGMACIIDAGEKNCIHPANKEVVGKRLAYLALGQTYGHNGIEYSGPVLKGMNLNGNLVELVFDHATNGLTTFGKELVNFEVAGEDKNFYPASAQITRRGIELSSLKVQKPIAVRYAFKDFVVGELYNTEGLPASSFRTDNWEK